MRMTAEFCAEVGGSHDVIIPLLIDVITWY